MRFPDACLQVFARAPRPGATKTRLIPVLGADGAAALHAAMVRHILTCATQPALCPVELWCAPTVDDPFFSACARDFPVTLHAQQGKDIGARMQHALTQGLAHAARVVLIGSDCPALTPALLAEAIAALGADDLDAIFTPALDGGYVLVGLRRVAPFLFTDMRWGDAEVMMRTRQRLRDAGWRWQETVALQDIDVPADLAALPASLRAAGFRPADR